MCIDTPHFATLRETRKEAPMAVSPSRAISQAGRRLTQVLQSTGPHAIGLCLPKFVAAETLYVASRFTQGSLRAAHLYQDYADALAALACNEVRAIWLFHPDDIEDSLQARRSMATTDLIIIQGDSSPDGMSADIFFPSIRGGSPSAEAKPDWWWIQQVALSMGFRAGLDFTSVQQIRREMARQAK